MPRARPETSESIRSGGAPDTAWGESQSRVTADFGHPLAYHWIYALENPRPEARIRSLGFLPGSGAILLFAVTHTEEAEHPLRLLPRAKFALRTEAGAKPPELAIDRGRIISVRPAFDYPGAEEWERSYALKPPSLSSERWIVEYAAHPRARIYGSERWPHGLPASELALEAGVTVIPERARPVTLHVRERGASSPAAKTAVRLHIHGEQGETIVPLNRHRRPNGEWFEDYGADCTEKGHFTTYIDGRAELRLPIGSVYVEITKGFEYVPIRRRFEISEETDVLAIELERGLDWRSRGWVTADTHVHFLSPQTALLQGKAEDLHMVHLLASQWGELFSNIGDFDGETTVGAKDAAGRGPYLVRVGTENRQAVLGHLSLLGYDGDMIMPLCTGGPMESALGDALEATMLTWAAKGREQDALVVLPHFPSPRGEEAAVYIAGLADAVEVCAWSCPHGGISAYSLSEWYRFLNCGYLLPVVGGTDKMSAGAAAGRLRTYSRLAGGAAASESFSNDEWKASVRGGETFVTVGPLLAFSVQGQPMGSRIDIGGNSNSNSNSNSDSNGNNIGKPSSSNVLEVRWEAASVTLPMTRVELVQGGEAVVRQEFSGVRAGTFSGSWQVSVSEPTWFALRIWGCQEGQTEAITAHSSPILVSVEGRTCLNAVDAASIMEQVEGALTFYETLATRPPEADYLRMRGALANACDELRRRCFEEGQHN
nr:CehA/McbA family metallohydrolase [Paenibacillus sacheonensis]